MEQVFDFREFVIKMFKKFKLAIILGLIFCLLGGAYGYLSYPNVDLMKTTSSASISFADSQQDATALSNAITNINAVVTYDTFYVGILQQLSNELSVDEMNELFPGDSTPKIKDVKELISIYIKGSVVFADVSCNNTDISKKASKVCIDYAIQKIPTFFEGTSVKYLNQQTVNMTNQSNDSKLKDTVKFAVLGFGGGIVLALLFIFFVDILDLRVKSKDDLKKYGLPILGEIVTKEAK